MMIHNDGQLARNRYWIDVFQRSLVDLIQAQKEIAYHPALYQAQISGMESMIEELRNDVDLYLKQNNEKKN